MYRKITSILLLMMAFNNCAQEYTGKTSIITPAILDDGWHVGSLQQTGIDSSLVQKMLKKIANKEYIGINSILIMKDNKLVFEQYFPGYEFKYEAKDQKGEYVDYNVNSIHNLASVTKSITALLCGIAIDKGYINSTEDKIFKFFPADSALFDSGKREISLFHLLTMSSGLQWNEQNLPYSNIDNDIIQLFIRPDPEKHILSKPLNIKPGTNFYYNGGGTNLVGRIIQKTSGERLDIFAQKNLFDPLGIKNAKWIFIQPDFVYASGDLRITSRDLAKIGSIVLNKGKWNNKQIVSREWIEQMTKKNVHFPNGDGYAYQWWIQNYSPGKNMLNCIAAQGWGGQQILVFSEINCVIVLTAENYNAKDPGRELLNRYILPAIKPDYDYDYERINSDAPFPDNVKIKEPANINLKSISGYWYGQWEYRLSTQLAVEKIENDSITVVYTWADSPEGYFKKGWLRHTTPFDNSGNFEFTINNSSWKYRYDNDDNVLTGYYKNEYVNDKVIMKKRN